eukprot:7530553-Pyramimonas_sp.AAC.1
MSYVMPYSIATRLVQETIGAFSSTCDLQTPHRKRLDRSAHAPLLNPSDPLLTPSDPLLPPGPQGAGGDCEAARPDPGGGGAQEGVEPAAGLGAFSVADDRGGEAVHRDAARQAGQAGA